MHQLMRRVPFICGLVVCNALSVFAQSLEPSPIVGQSASSEIAIKQSELEDVRHQLREQRAELDRLRANLAEQAKLIDELRQRREQAEPPITLKQSGNTSNTLDTGANIPPNNAPPNQQSTTERHDEAAQQNRPEPPDQRTSEPVNKHLASIRFSGDIRLRYESFYGQLNALPNADNPNVLGNALSTRQRARLRARLAVRGEIGKEFDWGLRLASGSFADAISANQTLTDFYNRKPFALDQAFITYKPERLPGLRVQGGKFEVPWTATEMTIDNDLQVEGLNESYSRDFTASKLKNLTLVAWQLPFLERNSAFVLDPNGTLNIDEQNRQGRDLALYGGQLRARLEPSAKLALDLSISNLHFSGARFITPLRFFGNQVELPVTITLPSTATAPAQTLASQVTLPRDLLVAGNANLGLSTATNNAINRDGRLASGFNLVDLIGRLDSTHSKRFPVTLLFNFVINTQARDIVIADTSGNDLLLRNNEKSGYWAELQVGKTSQRGDLFFGYTFTRIEKDAVLTPFNFSDLAQQSDMRAQRFIFAYAADPRVTFSLTGIITERANALRGVFSQTPPGSLNRPTTRLQLDTILRF